MPAASIHRDALGQIFVLAVLLFPPAYPSAERELQPHSSRSLSTSVLVPCLLAAASKFSPCKPRRSIPDAQCRRVRRLALPDPFRQPSSPLVVFSGCQSLVLRTSRNPIFPSMAPPFASST